ncbi:MAG: 4'-phosphopantetheinyl transferase superfamily protein [Oscillospiraceae bacterium]|nr:4'-phosphopantetheinyl transferase superfamily protein [Oscillospiraceae bacterium]
MSEQDLLLIVTDALSVSEEELRVLSDVLPEYRVQKAAKYRRREDRVNCITAFVMLAYLLETRFHCKLPRVLRTNPYGKPLLDAPLWMSISHCSGAACCAVSERNVGVDAENIVTRHQELPETVLSGEEYAEYLCSASPMQCFTAFWTQKEAYLKLRGTGLTEVFPCVRSAVNAEGLYCETCWYGDVCVSTCSETQIWQMRISIRELLLWSRKRRS